MRDDVPLLDRLRDAARGLRGRVVGEPDQAAQGTPAEELEPDTTDANRGNPSDKRLERLFTADAPA